MPKVEVKIKEALRPYQFHGLDVSGVPNSHGDLMTDCPFCGREDKLSISVETGQWRCFVCAAGTEKGGGNAVVFVRLLHELGFKNTPAAEYRKLTEARRLLYVETLLEWGWCQSPLTRRWMLPGYGPDGTIRTLYIWGDKLYPTPTLGSWVFGTGSFDAGDIDVCEGPWDGMALYEALGHAETGDHPGSVFSPTSDRSRSVGATRTVIAVPGCGSVGEPVKKWSSLVQGRDVRLYFDNDLPQDQGNGRVAQPAGLGAMRRAAELLRPLASSVKYLRWGDGEGYYDPELPHGYDLRDLLSGEKKEDVQPLAYRVERLGWIEHRMEDAPVTAPSNGKQDRAVVQTGHCLACSSWKELVNAWRKALRWTDGLDSALSAMLSSVITTQQIGEQLWFEIIGPPSCLAGSTPIYDPTDGSIRTVHDRWLDGKRFCIWTLREDGSVGIAQALPPERFQPVEMFELELKDGTAIKTTGGHRIWNGQTYVSVASIADALPACGAYHLPTTAGLGQLVHASGGLRSRQTAGGYSADCSAYSCHDDVLLPQAVKTYPGVPRLPAGAPGHTPANFCAGVLETSRRYIHHLRRWFARLSSCDVGLLGQRLLAALGYGPWISLGTCGRLSGSYPSDGRTQRPSTAGPSGRDQPVAGVAQLSRPHGSELLERQGSALCGPDPSSVFEPPRTGLVQIDTAAYRAGSSQGAIPGDGRACLTPQRPGEPFALVVDLLEESVESRRTYDPSYTSQRSAVEPTSLISVARVRGKVNPITLTKIQSVVNIRRLPAESYYDFCVPETNNYWACGLFHHNCGKTTVMEGISMNKLYVLSKDTIRGFYSGWRDGEGEDSSLIAEAAGKTLAMKEGDAFVKAPNVQQILSEGRGIYDRVGRNHYRNAVANEYEGTRMTWIICGTSAIREEIDSSELGARFLACVVMDGIDDEFEDDVLWRAVNQEARSMTVESDGDVTHQHPPELSYAMQLTGGYVTYLRQNATRLISEVQLSDEVLRWCGRLGKFVAYMRARPTKKDEHQEREFGARLAKQMVRLAIAEAAVTQQSGDSEDILRRVKKIAMDTAKSLTMQITELLRPSEGMDPGAIVLRTNQLNERVNRLLRFLRQIGVLEMKSVDVEVKTPDGIAKKRGVKKVYCLTPKLEKLYDLVHETKT